MLRDHTVKILPIDINTFSGIRIRSRILSRIVVLIRVSKSSYKKRIYKYVNIYRHFRCIVFKQVFVDWYVFTFEPHKLILNLNK